MQSISEHHVKLRTGRRRAPPLAFGPVTLRAAATPHTYGRAEAAILAATEELLVKRTLGELTVAEICDAAGVSRQSFYVHFSSKMAVIAACLRRLTEEVLAAVDPFLSGPSDDPEVAIRTSLEGWLELCKAHGALLRAASESWPRDDGLRELWFGILDANARATAKVIRAERKRGHAPPGADPAALAACLMWAYERVAHVALTGGARGLPTPDAIIDPLAQMVVGGLYGRPLASATGPH
jgi:AcrR family transcriptional regulator